MIKTILSLLIALILYDLLKIAYKRIIIKKNKENLNKIIGDLVYSTKMEKLDKDKEFWGRENKWI